ncbi:MAG: hypothetical protein J0L82_09980 [Deltaproteobacteria bacterium]|jgi:hypothetical protein|nr:hypothetical protein [Deltaproteobacteria bacterium]
MRYLTKAHNTGELAAESPEQSDVLLPSSYASLSQVIEKAIAMGLRVIVLEYPSNHGLPIRRMLAKYDIRIEVYDTRQWLLDSVEDLKLIDVFKSNIKHLTPFGADHFE